MMGNANVIDLPHQYGHYTLHEELGNGVFGTVFKASQTMQRPIALKIFEQERLSVAQREVAYLVKIKDLRSDRLCKMLTHYTINKHVAIAFELMYQSVYDVLKHFEFRGFKMRTTRMIARDVLHGLAALHNAHIAHCDLKPENIMFCTAQCKRVKIIDFGLARSSPCGQATYAQSRYYRAPEVVLGIGSDVLIDIWSLGCILPELFTGRVLFKAKTEEELAAFHKGVEGDYPVGMQARSIRSNRFFRAVGGGCVADMPSADTAYGAFVRACVTVDPSKRFDAHAALQHPFIEEV